MEKITFTVNGEHSEKGELSRCLSGGDTNNRRSGGEPEDLEKVDFYVLEKTRIGGTDYILVTDMEDGDGDALILKDLSKPEEKDGLYEIVSEEKELSAVAAVFETLMDDVTFVSDDE